MGFNQVFSGIKEQDVLVFDQFMDYLADLTARLQETFIVSNDEPTQDIIQESYQTLLGRNVNAPDGVMAFWFSPSEDKIKKVYKNKTISLGFEAIGTIIDDPHCAILDPTEIVVTGSTLGTGGTHTIDYSNWTTVLHTFRLRLANATNLGTAFIRWNSSAAAIYYYNMKYLRGDGTELNQVVRATTSGFIPHATSNTVVPGSTALARYQLAGLGIWANLGNQRHPISWYAHHGFLSNVSGEVTNASLTRIYSGFQFHSHIFTSAISSVLTGTTGNSGFLSGSRWTTIGLK